MATTPTRPLSSTKQQFLNAFEREHAITLRVVRAYPADKLDLRPHPKSKSAGDLAWQLVMGHGLLAKALTTGFDWSTPPAPHTQAPGTIGEIVEALDREHDRIVQLVRAFDEEKLGQPVKFFVAPKTLGDVPTIEFLWFVLFDQVHHRGQFSVYLRMAEAKVPSIYGPTADEPWL
jgi:uncharacterized damage-inducible protein DinB